MRTWYNNCMLMYDRFRVSLSQVKGTLAKLLRRPPVSGTPKLSLVAAPFTQGRANGVTMMAANQMSGPKSVGKFISITRLGQTIRNRNELLEASGVASAGTVFKATLDNGTPTGRRCR